MAIVLDQRGVPLRKRPFWRKQANRHRKLQQCNDQSREQRLKQPRRAGHYIIIAARGQFVRESLPVGWTRLLRALPTSRDPTAGNHIETAARKNLTNLGGFP